MESTVEGIYIVGIDLLQCKAIIMPKRRKTKRLAWTLALSSLFAAEVDNMAHLFA